MSQYMVVSSDTVVKRSAGKLKGFLCTVAASTPTLAIYDGLSASGTKIIDTFTPVAGTLYSLDFSDGVFFSTGLFVDIGNTVTITVIYE